MHVVCTYIMKQIEHSGMNECYFGKKFKKCIINNNIVNYYYCQQNGNIFQNID